MPGTQRPEKIIKDTEKKSHQKSGQEPAEGNDRHRHPSHRRQREPGRDSS